MRARLLLLPPLLLLGSLLPSTRACTGILVGSAATVDGSVIIARNDDGEDFFTGNHLFYHPPRPSGAVWRSNVNKLQVELPPKGLAYKALPVTVPDPLSGRNASGEASGVNSAGVACSATITLSNSVATLRADPYDVQRGVGEDAIPSLVLPQATSARQGMRLLGALIESRGASEGFGTMIADAEEAWYMETAGGHHWMALRIPDDSFFVTGNQGRFQKVHLTDTANVMYSPTLVDFAINSGLVNPHCHKCINFFKAFMDDNPVQHTYSKPRVQRLQQRFGKIDEVETTDVSHTRDDTLPVFVRPKHKMSVRDVMAALRDHYEGTSHDPYMLRNPHEKYRPIAVLRSFNGHISQLRPGMPDGISAVQYVAMAMPALSPFIPIYKGLPGDALPRALAVISSEPDGSLFWRARRLQALVFQDWPMLAPHAAAGIAEFETNFFSWQQPAFEKRYTIKFERGDKSGATAELVSFTAMVVRQAEELLVRLTEGAAAQLGLGGVPSDDALTKMLDKAIHIYGFLPPDFQEV